MCGIVGYTGGKQADSVLLVGLKRLEYRGYDSAGVAVHGGRDIIIRKQKGKIKDLQTLLERSPIEGHTGIGHTRWATHGEPSTNNAHPHTDGSRRLAVVHNGIIENYRELSQELIDQGHVFQTDTDSEVIPHLIESFMKQDLPVENSIKNTLARLDGRYAFALLFDGQPERIYFAKKGSPLVFGKGKDDSYLASDTSAMVPGAQEQYFIEDGQWGWITRNELFVFDEEGEPVEVELETVQVKAEDLDLGDFDHFMLKEIYEQPEIMRKILEARLGDNGKIFMGDELLSREFQSRISRILIASAGTSWHAGLVAKTYLESFARVSTEVDLSSEFRYRNPIAGGDTLFIAISQSGETADTLAGIFEAKAQFMKTLSFINNAHSTMARESHAFIELMAGPEIGVASTKAYTTQLLHLLLYAVYLGSIKWLIPPEKRNEIIEEIKLLPEKMDRILQQADEIKKWAHSLRNVKDFVFLGRAFNYPTALEGALKLKEISYVHASGYAGGEFKHGPIALISEEVPVVAIIPNTENREKMISNIEEVKARKGIILSIHTEGDQDVESVSDYSFAIPEAPDYLTPILAVLPLQLLAYYMALEKGCEPDQPRNLAKSVTVE